VDDGSTDNSLSVIKKYGDKIKWVHHENVGPSASRNQGFQMSKGKYIQFIDADDYISSTKISEQVDFLEISGKDIVYSDWCRQIYNVDNTVNSSHYITHQTNEDIEDMIYYILKNNTIHCGSCLCKREAIEKISGFDETLRIAEDYDFFVRLAFSGARFSYMEGCHYFYRVYNSITASHGQGIKYPNSVKYALDKMSLYLVEHGLLTHKYCHAMAYKYFIVAKMYLALGDFKESNLCYEISNNLLGKQKIRFDENTKFDKLYNLLGWKITSAIIYPLYAFKISINKVKSLVYIVLPIVKARKYKS
ncbi:MAG: glycosyltransferase family 2 protein, partial [Pseudanabaena sp.]